MPSGGLTASPPREDNRLGGGDQHPAAAAAVGIGPREHLEAHGIPVRVDAPGVGANLQDHPEGIVE